MSGATLESNADYGKLPFDIFCSPYQHRAQFSLPELSEEMKLVLSAHQTAHERMISLVSSDGLQTVWLRTCYDQALVTKYEEIKRKSNVPGGGVSENKILDDPSRYDFGDNGGDSWRQVLVRVPGITDFRGIIDMDGDGSNMQYITQLRFQAGLYLLDREAIETGSIKVLWLDEHGQIAWENRLDPFTSRLEGLTGALMNATDLIELAGYNGTRGARIEN
ncbi:uncharacterized protein KD926_008607 [Aspergillus affinis]|uniref:uncharacterized protein n=1 Tax=Aspergillus affinis TaxID=1070780 RepID=UPI0022FE24D3|nr:uncharacterized protein KD926_008607 [Aspergillus affinis]KAI9040044.1 hypothetical protein KD926_008607 [Aspergillus affinis]